MAITGPEGICMRSRLNGDTLIYLCSFALYAYICGITYVLRFFDARGRNNAIAT